MTTNGKAERSVLAFIWTAFRAVGRWASRLAVAGMFAISLLSVALTAAMTVSGSVFNAVSGIVEAVYDGATVRRRQNGELLDMRRKLDTEVASSKRLRRELAERPVTYRGSKRLAREAVADTSERVARRVAAGAVRTVASAGGEALPLVGVGVVAAATAYDLYDACEMMKELHALDVAFNPDSAISDREVCGMRAPTKEEIWTSVKASPEAAWSTATSYYQGLSADDVSAMFGSAYGWILSWNPWADANVAGRPPDEPPVAAAESVDP